jgi:hypothetical protein
MREQDLEVGIEPHHDVSAEANPKEAQTIFKEICRRACRSAPVEPE